MAVLLAANPNSVEDTNVVSSSFDHIDVVYIIVQLEYCWFASVIIQTFNIVHRAYTVGLSGLP